MQKDQSSDLLPHSVREIVYVTRGADGLSKGSMSSVSDNVQALLGYKPEDFLKNDYLWFSIIHPEDAKEIERAFREISVSRKPATLTYRVRHRNTGEYRWMEDVVTPRFDTGGIVVSVAGSAVDITDRMKLEEALKESEELFHASFENSMIGIALIGNDGKYQRVNGKFCDMLGHSREELLKVGFQDLSHPEDAEKGNGILAEAFAGSSKKSSVEKRFVRKDGKIIWVDFSATLVRDHKGKPAYLIANFHDITERKREEEVQQQERALLRTLIDNLPNSVFVKDREYRRAIVNPAHVRGVASLTGNADVDSEAKLFGKTDFEIYPRELAERFFAEDKKVILEGIPVLDREEFSVGADNQRHWVLISKLPLKDREGAIIGLVGITTDITAQKLAEEAAQHERILLRALIDNLPHPMYVKDKECRKLISNLADVKNMGMRSEADVLGKTDFEIFPREMAKKSFADDQTVIREGKPVLNRTEYFYDASGERHWFLTSKVPFRDESGAIVGLVGNGVDITDRVEIEEALRQSEAELRALFGSMKDVIVVVDADGRYLNVPVTDPSVLYRPANEIIGRTTHEVFPKEQADAFLSTIHRALQTGETQRIEYALLIQGAEKWRAATVSPMADNTALWVARDITERKLMEKEISASEKKYRELVENALVGVYKTKLNGDIIYANKAMSELLEYDSPQELMTVRSPSIYKSIDERNDFIVELRKYGRTIKSKEVELVTRSGKIRNVLLSASLDGDVISGMLKDITEIRVLERQFIQTQKLEGLGNIAAGIAHDFNNLLGVILGYSDLLKQSKFDPQKFEHGIQAITRSAERGKSLVQQLLTFARKTEAMFKPVQLNEIIVELERLVKETFPRTIEVHLGLRKDLPLVMADATQIHQMFLNICLNARDAMPKGGILSISTEVVSGEVLHSRHAGADESGYVEIRVSDTGVGMSDETRQHVFEPFFTTKGIGKGTGLGLSVVYGIVESHGGFVEVTSELGHGTTFNFYFPAQQRGPGKIEPQKENAEPVTGGTDTILVIEDEEMLRELLKTILVSKGYGVITAQDGEEGIAMFRESKERLTLVISDLGLPKLSGEEVVGKIKDIDPHARIIVASGFIDPDLKANLEKTGVRHFVQKPYKANEVLKTIRDEIDSQA